jgi:hypothetical protein
MWTDAAQAERDQKAMGQALIVASDVILFAMTCWLLALTAQAFTQLATTPTTQTWARAGYGTAGSFLALGAAASLCVTTRLFQTHYKDHPPRLFEK